MGEALVVNPTDSAFNWLWLEISTAIESPVDPLQPSGDLFYSGLSGGTNCQNTPIEDYKNGNHYCYWENSTWWKLGILITTNVIFLTIIVGVGLLVFLIKIILDAAVGYDGLKQGVIDLNESLGSAFPYPGRY